MKAPITLIENAINNPEKVFSVLWNELAWRDVAGPRLEYYCNDIPVPYTYGRGVGVRTYDPQPVHPAIAACREVVEKLTVAVMEVCFLNGYRDGSDHLGWHADDSPEMDPRRPIAIVSLGARREIYFREKGPASLGFDTEKVWLPSGSVCIMPAGMQETHFHRIPKASYSPCGARISLTFRGYVKPE